MKQYKITYYLGPGAKNIEITISAKDYAEACVFAKTYRKDAFSIQEL